LDLGFFSMGLATSVTAVAPVGAPIFARVAANSDGGSSLSNEVSFTVALPRAPTMNAPLVAGSTVTLSWTGEAASYFVLARLSPAGQVVGSLPVSASTVTVSGVGAGTYYVTVVGVSGGSTSAESNQQLVRVP
jgi:hypothetical protein